MDFSKLTLQDLYAEKNARLQLLGNSDYKAIKAFEGCPSADRDEVKPKRKQWREDINAIEPLITALEASGAQHY